MNLGKPIFAALAVLAFVVALAHGLPPIGVLEALLWSALAALWTVKNWRNERLNYALLALAALVFVGEGYMLGHNTAQPKAAAKPKAPSLFDDALGTSQAPNPKPADPNPINTLLACFDDHKRHPELCDDPKVIRRYIKRAEAKPYKEGQQSK